MGYAELSVFYGTLPLLFDQSGRAVVERPPVAHWPRPALRFVLKTASAADSADSDVFVFWDGMWTETAFWK
mgnify:CR=1 FL=1